MRQHLGPIVYFGTLSICLNCNRPQSTDPCLHDSWIRQQESRRLTQTDRPGIPKPKEA